jgi:hypothetical protein
MIVSIETLIRLLDPQQFLLLSSQGIEDGLKQKGYNPSLAQVWP